MAQNLLDKDEPLSEGGVPSLTLTGEFYVIFTRNMRM